MPEIMKSRIVLSSTSCPLTLTMSPRNLKRCSAECLRWSATAFKHSSMALSFTPDGRPYLGPAPEVKGVYLATGMNSNGILNSGGVGLTMAEWLIDGRPHDLCNH